MNFQMYWKPLIEHIWSISSPIVCIKSNTAYTALRRSNIGNYRGLVCLINSDFLYSICRIWSQCMRKIRCNFLKGFHCISELVFYYFYLSKRVKLVLYLYQMIFFYRSFYVYLYLSTERKYFCHLYVLVLTLRIQLCSVLGESFQSHPFSQKMQKLLQCRSSWFVVVHFFLAALARHAVHNSHFSLETQLLKGNIMAQKEKTQ